MPSDSHFAIAMKTQKEAERAEQQRIKNLVLNYDLQDSSVEQAGIAYNPFDHFSNPNPNIRKPSGGHTSLIPLHQLDEKNLAHTMSHEGFGAEKHFNTSLHQSSNSNTNTRSADRSSSNRSGHRARKLQLSDVDWYDRRPASSRSRERGPPLTAPAAIPNSA